MYPPEDYHAGIKRRALEREQQAAQDYANDQADMARRRAARAEQEAKQAAAQVRAVQDEADEVAAEYQDLLASSQAALEEECNRSRHAAAGLAVALRALRSLVATIDAFTASDCSDDAYPALRAAWRESVELLHVVDGTQPVGEVPPIPPPEVPPIPPPERDDWPFPDLDN